MEEDEREKMEKLFIERFESSFDFIVRGYEDARTVSHHAKFAAAVGEFCGYLETTELEMEPGAQVIELLQRMLPIATHALKLEREFLKFPSEEMPEDLESEQMIDDALDSMRERLRRPLEAWSALIKEEACFSEGLHFLHDDVSDAYGDLARGYRYWAMNTPEGTNEALFHWHLCPSHWEGHLYRAMSSLNTIKHRDLDSN